MTARHTKGGGDASVHARTRVLAWGDHQLIELDVVGMLDSEQHSGSPFRADEAKALAKPMLEAAEKMRRAKTVAYSLNPIPDKKNDDESV
ncbi:hypothetical protein [Burkholderia stabilis]|uniref:hypothetical protein n=1 Tax=Burkholderia stabilis TaxID=95485 RepID=UPI001FC831E2|nr:hypothetical protein [Burkholderia stabilis]